MKIPLMLLLVLTISESKDEISYGCTSNAGNYTVNSTYSTNLHTTLSSLSSITNGFHNASFGYSPDTVYATALCRADISLSDCRQCVQNSAIQLRQFCPNQKQAIVWDELCTLRYSDDPIYGIVSYEPRSEQRNSQDGQNPELFRQDRTLLLEDVREKAVNGGWMVKAGAGSRNTSYSQTIYGLMQCGPDLSSGECDECLKQASQTFGMFSWTGVRMLRPSCTVRYEIYLFYNQTRLQELQLLVTPGTADNNTIAGKDDDDDSGGTRAGKDDDDGGTRAGKDNTTTKIVVIVVLLMLFSCLLIYLRRRINQTGYEIPQAMGDISTPELLQYDFHEISAATGGFADTNKLGQGGFGAVYKGTLSNGQETAVKRLSRKFGQGHVEFKNEILLLARLQHRNLVRLLGFSLEGLERLLIYEFVSNGSLDRFIFDSTKSASLGWDARYKIIGGIAKGLLYLHEDSRLKIIHRDLKASNILLDANMNPKIADFGMAKLFGQDETQRNTKTIVGTYGYMSPEYAIHGSFSMKSDVFSFGVLVLEIVSGQKNLIKNGEDVQGLPSVVWEHWRKGKPENVVDLTLKAGKGSLRDMLRCVHVGLLCVQKNPIDRPTMKSVVMMLNSTTITLPVPLEPAFVMSSRFGPNTSEIIKTGVSDDSTQNEMSVTKLCPR